MEVGIVQKENAINLSLDNLEEKMLHLEQVPCPVIHHFHPGVYMREVFVPAGTMAMGHYQRFSQSNIFLKGKVIVFEDSGDRKELTAPMTFVGPPGRKVGYVLEDMVWINVYSTELTDVEEIEKIYLDKSAVFNDAISTVKVDREADRVDFLETLHHMGIPPEVVRLQSLDSNDLCGLPYGSYKFKTGKSDIEGTGLRASADILPGEIIAPARINGFRTLAGRYANHAKIPNAKMVRGGGTDINLVATKKIHGCYAGFDGEEITVSYQQAFELNLSIKGDACQV